MAKPKNSRTEKTERQILAESMGVTEEQLRDMQEVRLEFPKGGTIYQFSLGEDLLENRMTSKNCRQV
jgi:hypothetical protein